MSESNNFKNISVPKDLKNKFVSNKMVQKFVNKKVSMGKIAAVALEMFIDPSNKEVAEDWLNETVAVEHNAKIDKKKASLNLEIQELEKQKIAA